MKTILFLSLLVSSVFFSCDPVDKLIIHNSSEEEIFAYITCDDSISLDYEMRLQDVMPRNGKDEIIDPPYLISGKSMKAMTIIGTWEQYVARCHNQSLKVFFLTRKIIEDNSWQDIVSNQIFAKKQQYSVGELDSTQWTIKYP